MNKGYISCIMLGIMVLLFFVVSLLIGSVSIPVSETFRILIGEESVKPSWQYIVIESRLPQAVTAMLCGASLAVCGLILQTAFRNPLAGPSIFGVNSGAGLGVALVMLFFGGSVSAGTVSIGGFMAVLLAAFAGAMGVMALIFFFSTLVRSHVMLLIVGIMIGYMAGSAISLLNFLQQMKG